MKRLLVVSMLLGGALMFASGALAHGPGGGGPGGGGPGAGGPGAGAGAAGAAGAAGSAGTAGAAGAGTAGTAGVGDAASGPGTETGPGDNLGGATAGYSLNPEIYRSPAAAPRGELGYPPASPRLGPSTAAPGLVVAPAPPGVVVAPAVPTTPLICPNVNPSDPRKC